MKTTKQNDLGHAKIGRLILSMSLPSIAAQIINVLYNVVDLSLIHISEPTRH